MILESAQMLSTAHRITDGNDYADEQGLYKTAHKNHPSTLWARQSKWNYMWLFDLFRFLCAEYTTRYGKYHASERLLSALSKIPSNIDPLAKLTPVPQCMPEQYKMLNAMDAYRNYYKGEKSYFAKWNKGTAEPEWWAE
tara:strand:- start:1314 stop:1730 length:417 start_codon:yes stop_codon:yes gene_type:complete